MLLLTGMEKACEEPEKLLRVCAASIARDGQMRIGKYCNVWATFIFAVFPHQVGLVRNQPVLLPALGLRSEV